MDDELEVNEEATATKTTTMQGKKSYYNLYACVVERNPQMKMEIGNDLRQFQNDLISIMYMLPKNNNDR